MRAVIAVAVLAASASCSKPAAMQNDMDASDPIPQKGSYHFIHERVQGNESSQDEYDSDVEVSDRETFEKELAKDEGSNCRDKQVSIGGGSFNVHMTCETPDGDFRNISVDRFGTYSKTSFDLTTQSTFAGISYQETFRAHLNAS